MIVLKRTGAQWLAMATALSLGIVAIPGPAWAQAAPEATAISIGAPAVAELRQRVILQALLVDVSGAPVEKVAIFFTNPVVFLGGSGDVVVAKAVTNGDGLATAEYEVRSTGQLSIRAEFRGNQRYASSNAIAAIAVTGATQLYAEHAGVEIPGLNIAPGVGTTMLTAAPASGPLAGLPALWPTMSIWPIALVLLLVWSIYSFVVALIFRLAADAPAGRRAVKWNFTIPGIAALMVPSLATMLLTIGVRSPYTHSNLQPSFDAGYTRTEQSVVGSPVSYKGARLAASSLLADSSPLAVGRGQLVAKSCVNCHGLDGQGGVVGPPIAGFDVETLREKTRKGPGGMPAFPSEELTDDQLDAMATALATTVQRKGNEPSEK